MMKEHFTNEILNKPIRKVKKESNCASEKKQKKKTIWM